MTDKLWHEYGYRGKLRANVALAKYSWFRTGGKADWFFEPADTEDLQDILQRVPQGLPVNVLGVGSNMLVRDGGVEGLVIRLGKAFTSIAVSEELGPKEGSKEGHAIEVGAAAMDVHVAKFAANNNIAGLEYLVGIPGTIGGALAMNAGAYGGEIKDNLIWAQAVGFDGKLYQFSLKDFAYSYRHSALPRKYIFTKALLRGQAGEKAVITAELENIMTKRQESQPIGTRTGGSSFKNPNGHKAWELIDAAGCRGLTIGGAQMSEKHCNFMINTGGATAQDIETLGETVRQKVQENSGVCLDWEIERIGRP